jgi:hypothetical protein
MKAVLAINVERLDEDSKPIDKGSYFEMHTEIPDGYPPVGFVFEIYDTKGEMLWDDGLIVMRASPTLKPKEDFYMYILFQDLELIPINHWVLQTFLDHPDWNHEGS